MLYIWSVTTRIPASQCPAVVASFGVVQNVNPSTLNECGPILSSCVINGLPSLNDAINKCDEDTDTCQAFTYDNTLSQMVIVDPVLPPTPGTSTVYTRLRGVRTLNTR